VVPTITILGIHDGHNAGAAIIQNGKVLAAVSEERLTNIKNFSGVPRLSIHAAIAASGIVAAEIDLVVLGCLVRATSPLQDEQTVRMRLYKKMAPLFQSHILSDLMVKGFHRVRRMGGIREVLEDLGLEKKEILFVDHHASHAACAYYQRPWEEETLVLTLDGAGDNLSAAVHVGRGDRIERIASTTFYHSLGNNLYSEITGYLGMKRWEHEYKVMGLAPYGDPEACLDVMRRIVRIHPRRPLEFQNTIGAYSTELQGKLRRLLAGRRFDDIAAACQKHFEDLATQWVGNAVRETNLHRIACAGGMFLNVKANKLIREMPEVDEAFFYPAADDGGTPVGAALLGYYRLCEREKIASCRVPLQTLAYGRRFSEEQIEQAICDNGWRSRAERIDGIEKAVAHHLANGKIIARFFGREEWGPRALGNRSILADPRDLRVVRKINFAIKHRDFWMPFAPSILERDLDAYLVDARPARYMIEAFDTKPRAEELIAGLHPFDRTARPQSVAEDTPEYCRILEEFRSATGVGGVLNTSFNLHGYPIVGSPDIALKTLEHSGLDGLAIGHWLVMREPAS
jgi:carbamoyltransferase